MKKLFSIALFALFTSPAFAQDITGSYVGTDTYGQIDISARGPNYLMKTCMSYDQCYEVTALLEEISPGQFRSVTAFLTLHYEFSGRGGFDCRYPLQFQISQSGDELFLSHHGPGIIFNQWPYYSCPPASRMNYGDYVAERSYTRKQ